MSIPTINIAAAPGPIAGEDPSIIYPSSDGERIAESDTQYIPLADTYMVLSSHFSDRPEVYVSADILIYYEMNNPCRSIVPDVLVAMGIPDHLRDNYLVWREGKAPGFVLEITSSNRLAREAIAKRDIYAGMGVSEHWRYDPTGRYLDPPLIGETLDSRGLYRRIDQSDAYDAPQGYSQVLGLDLRVVGNKLRLFDPMCQTWLLTLAESAAARRASETACQAAETARRAAKARTADLLIAREVAARAAAEARVAEMERMLREHGIAFPDAARRQ